METMNYNRDNKKGSKAGIISFLLFVCIGSGAVIYMIANEPEAKIIGQDMYVPVTSPNTEDNVDIYSEIDVSKITYSIKNKSSKSTSGKFKSNISVPQITVNSVVLEDINKKILDKFIKRYNVVKSEASNLEHPFTYKVTYNKYETNIDRKRMISFTFYERIIDDSSGSDTTYKLYAFTIDLATKQLMTQDEAALIVLGSTYKTIIKNQIKAFVIKNKLFSENKYLYSLTGLEEFYIKDKKLHIMFNPGEMGNNRDYLDITINN